MIGPLLVLCPLPVCWAQTPLNIVHEISLSRFGTYRAAWPADADGDANEDLLALSSEKLVWFRNEGGGNYAAPEVEQHITKGARAPKRADVDADGLEDIVVICPADSTISWFRNLGAPGFAPLEVLLQISAVPFTFEMRRIDADDDLDIALGFTQLNGSEVQWWSNDGLQFSGPMHIYNLNPPYSVKGFLLGDLDLDGDADAIVSLLDHVGVCYANGTGGFAPLSLCTEDLDDVIRFTTMVDADADADMDLLVCTESELRCFLNTGAPIFDETVPLLTGQGNLQSVQAIELLPNGMQELIVQDVPNARLCALEPGPTLSVLATHRMAGSAFFLLNDHDVDGDDDLLFADGGLGHLVHQASGVFLAWPSYAHLSLSWPLDVATGDLNGDGARDLVVSGLQKVSFFFNDGTPNFHVAPPVSIPSGAGPAAAVDIDADGYDEVFVCMEDINGDQGGLALIGNAMGVMTDLDTLLVAETVINHVGSADVDANGTDDILFAHQWVDQVGVFYTVGQGALSLVLTGSLNANSPNLVFAGDLDGDGYKDLVRDALSTVSDIQWHRNNTIGGFPGALPMGHVLPAADELVGGFNIGDLNNDGYVDVVASVDDGTEQTTVYLNNWNGTAWTKVALEPPLLADDLVIGDIDADGYNDILGLKEDTPAPWVWMATGAGSFAAGVELASMISRVHALALDDLDGDGDLDLLVSGMDTAGTSLFSNGVYWYENDGSLVTAHEERVSGMGRFSLSPNPSSGMFTVSGTGPDSVFDEVEVVSADGRILYQVSQHPGALADLEISHLPEGAYGVRVLLKGVPIHCDRLVILRS